MGNGMYNTGQIIGFPAGFVFGWTLADLLVQRKTNNAVLGASGILSLGSIILSYSGKAKMIKAQKKYNSNSKDTGINFNLILEGETVGVVFYF